jgi:hypothetical protein
MKTKTNSKKLANQVSSSQLLTDKGKCIISYAPNTALIPFTKSIGLENPKRPEKHTESVNKILNCEYSWNVKKTKKGDVFLTPIWLLYVYHF